MILIILNGLATHIFIISELSLRVDFCWRCYLKSTEKNTVYCSSVVEQNKVYLSSTQFDNGVVLGRVSTFLTMRNSDLNSSYHLWRKMNSGAFSKSKIERHFYFPNFQMSKFVHKLYAKQAWHLTKSWESVLTYYFKLHWKENSEQNIHHGMAGRRELITFSIW